MKQVLLLDYIVIVIYMGITLGVGFYFMRFNRGAADFFRGGNKIPWLVSGLSAFMTGFSAWTFTAASGIAYNHGIIIIFMYLGNACTFIFGYSLFAVRWRRARISSPMEYLSGRFNQATRQIFSWSTIFFDMFMVAVWLYALGEFMSVSCQVPMEWIIIGSATVILVYCWAGGLWAVVITEFIQGIILLAFTVVLVIAVLVKFDGILELISSLPPEMLRIGHSEYSSWTFLTSWTVMVIFGYNTRAHAQRYFSVDTEKSAKKIAVLNFFLFIVGAFVWFIPPMAARAVYPNIAELWPGGSNPHEGAYAVISLTLLPSGLIGVMLAAIFSACMSNVSSFYNLFAAIITKDIFPFLTKTKLDDRQSMAVGRLSTLVIGILVPALAILMVMSGKSSFKIMNTFNTIISIAYGPPALIGLVYKKSPHWSGLVYFIFALSAGCIGWFALGWDIPQNVFYVVPFSFIVMFGSSFLERLFKMEKDEYKQKRKELFRRLDTPIEVGEEVGETADITFVVFRFLSKITAGIALFILVFSLFNPKDQINLIFLYSILTFLIAAFFWFAPVRRTGSAR